MSNRLIYDTSKKLGTSEFDVWRLGMKYQLGSLQVADLVKRYGTWLRNQKVPAWMTDFCLDILSGKETISKKELRPNLKWTPLKGGT